MEVYYIYTYENKIMKLSNTVWKRRGGEGEWKYNGEDELVQGTLYTCMELSQWNPLVFVYDKSKMKFFKNLRIKIN
jgi:hypothetical protein